MKRPGTTPIANALIAEHGYALVLPAEQRVIGVVRGPRCWSLDTETGTTIPCGTKPPKPPRKRKREV